MVGELEESKLQLEDGNRSALVEAGPGEAEGGGTEAPDASDSEGEDLPARKKRTSTVKKIEGEGHGECSSGDESQVSSESEAEQYVEDAVPVKYKIIDVKLGEVEPAFYKKPTLNKNNWDPHKQIRLECRKGRSKVDVLIAMCSKKQNAMMIQTTQAQHLVGAQAQQVEQ